MVVAATVAAGGKGIALSLDPSDPGNEEKAVLVFDRTNWFKPQTVYISAPMDNFAEGTRVLNIQHSVKQGASSEDGGAYDDAKVATVE